MGRLAGYSGGTLHKRLKGEKIARAKSPLPFSSYAHATTGRPPPPPPPHISPSGADLVGHSLQMHSSLIRRLSMEQALEDATQTITNGFLLCSLFEQGHQGCGLEFRWFTSDDERLGKHKETLDFAVAAQCLSPYDTMAAEKVENIKKTSCLTADAEKNNKASDGARRSEPRTGRVLSLTDILYRSEANSDVLQDGPRSEREDSDFDEELELDFETSMSGDEGRNVESNILHGSLNLRIHRRGDSTRETETKLPINDGYSMGKKFVYFQYLFGFYPKAAIDMKRRYAGHCNVGTDIKQASFLGQRVVNCVQCHPFDCFVATSGMVVGGSAGPEAVNVFEAMESK
ncbi:hypothetical protein V6N12_040764 [Hibiscus sabdariffa]|uniref:Uncharacterized protein n=1 Tax=Hibiscus sabdariffa TaxID=183260 RepID=A0ABR2E4L9_9ROSI